jgi:membrane protein required for colicin V production
LLFSRPTFDEHLAMPSYDVLMLLVLAAAALWGYWKGFVWQLASLLSIFCSYFAAYGLRTQVAKLIDADPPWNMFAAMLIVYLLSSVGIWLGTAMMSGALNAFQLKDFDRQVGALFGVAKGAIFCVLITFFAVTLMGRAQAERICQSNSGYYIARILERSSGLMPPELAGVVGPYLNPFQDRLQGYQHGGLAEASPDQSQQQPQHPLEQQPQSYWPPPAAAWEAAQAWGQAVQQMAPQQSPQQYGYPPPDPRWNQPQTWPQPAPNQPPQQPYYNPPQYAPPAQGNYPPGYPTSYQQPSYPPSYPPPAQQPTYDPRYDPRYAQPYPNQASAQSQPQYAPPPQSPPQQPQPASDGRYYWR